MKARIAIFFLLLMSTAVYAQQSSDATYPIKIHVFSCRLVGSIGTLNQQLDAVINGQHYQLRSEDAFTSILHQGYYQARIIKQDTGNAYETGITYEVKFPDGKTRSYLLTD